MDTSAQTWDHSGHDLQGIMPARSSHDNLIDFTPLGDPAALLGLHLGSDSATIAHGHASLPQLLPQHPPLLSSPATAAPQFSQHPDPRRHWDAWNPLLVTNPQPSLNLQPVPIDSRPVHSYQQSAPSDGGTLYNRSVRLSDSGYVSNSHAARSVSAASSYAVDTSCSPQLASHQGPEFAENFCSSPVQERETSMQHVSELIRCDHPNCSWTGKCPSDKRKHEARHWKLFRCDEPNCSRKEGFGTINDLARHKKCVHKQEPVRGPKVLYMCFGRDCPRKNKQWPRLDNFKQHLARMHSGEDAAELLKKSEEWYQGHVSIQEAIGKPLPRSDSGNFGAQQQGPVFPEHCTAVIPSQTITSSDFLWSPESTSSNPASDISGDSTDISACLQSRPHLPTQPPFQDQVATQPPSQDRTDSVSSSETAKDGKMEATVNEAAKNVINAMTRMINSSQRRKQQQQEDGAGMMNSSSELCGRRKELVQKILSVALHQLSTDQPATRAASEPQPEAGKEGWFACQHCPKRTRLRCEMKKHQKRHERPYGCTFDECNKTFGSKADWKRHESSQHFHFQGWRCNLSDPDNVDRPCARLYDQQEMYVQHLLKQHNVDEDFVHMVLEKNYLDQNGQVRYWCGFCQDLMPLRSRGLAAWNERFNHIDSQHFKKGQRIGDWLPLSGHLTKKRLDENDDTRTTSDEDYDDDDTNALSSDGLSNETNHGGLGSFITMQRNNNIGSGLKKRRRASAGSVSRKSRKIVNTAEDSESELTEADLGLEPVPELFS